MERLFRGMSLAGNNRNRSTSRTLAVVLAIAAIGLLAGAASAGWVENGVAIFLTMAESGLAWCL